VFEDPHELNKGKIIKIVINLFILFNIIIT
jgi:hypothetical protein